jgi:hypothetical protein
MFAGECVPRSTGGAGTTFPGMSPTKLAALFDLIKATIPDGLRISLVDFETRLAAMRPEVLQDTPRHATVHISVWGLQFEFPEDYFIKDIEVHLESAKVAQTVVDHIVSVGDFVARRKELGVALRRASAGCRSGLVACFSLVESYLNGLAWRLCNTDKARFASLSQNEQKLLLDSGQTNLRKKLLSYPALVRGVPLFDAPDEDVDAFLSLLKPFRDSLCHPSPFEAPEKFGGYDKLSKVYGMTPDIFASAVMVSLKLIERIHRHVNDASGAPSWMRLRVTERPTVNSNPMIDEGKGAGR